MNFLKTSVLSLAFVTCITAVASPIGVSAKDTDNQITEYPEIFTYNLAPQNVLAWDAESYDKVRIKWDKVPGAGSYAIYMADREDGKYTKVATTKSDSCLIDGLITGKKMFFKVQTVIDLNNEQFPWIAESFVNNTETKSDIVSATPKLEAPKAKSYLRTGSKAQIEWKKVDGADGYFLYEKDSDGKWSKIKKARGCKGSKCMRSSLKKRKTHTYKIAAYRTSDEGTSIGKSSKTSIYVPKLLTSSTKTYSMTYQSKVIKLARTKLGAKYLWGASGPKKFDCSGFTYWVMKKSKLSGVKFKRTSSQGMYYNLKKYNLGKKLSKAQPGDIILYGRNGSKKRIYHAAIYYGNNKTIHATTSGRSGKVKITRIWDSGEIVAIIRLPGLR